MALVNSISQELTPEFLIMATSRDIAAWLINSSRASLEFPINEPYILPSGAVLRRKGEVMYTLRGYSLTTVNHRDYGFIPSDTAQSLADLERNTTCSVTRIDV